GRLAGVERRLSADLFGVLNLADQARLEGRRGSAISIAAIEAAALLIRIAYRFQAIAHARLAGSELRLPQDVRERYAGLEQEYCTWIESNLGKLEVAGSSEQPMAASATSRPIEASSLNDEGLSSRMIQATDWSAYGDATLTPQVEAYRRLP